MLLSRQQQANVKNRYDKLDIIALFGTDYLPGKNRYLRECGDRSACMYHLFSLTGIPSGKNLH
jgi:hypothetical protein